MLRQSKAKTASKQSTHSTRLARTADGRFPVEEYAVYCTEQAAKQCTNKSQMSVTLKKISLDNPSIFVAHAT